MQPIPPLETLFETPQGTPLPLPPQLAAFYGPLAFPTPPARPHLIGNFVSTLDGVTSLQSPNKSDGGPISGNNPHDHMLMGLLRAAADAVIVGAGTLRTTPTHLWTAAHIYPPLAGAYQRLRTNLRKPASPLNVFITARGDIDPTLPVFHSDEVPVLLITTSQGAQHLRTLRFPASVQIIASETADQLTPRSILQIVQRVLPSNLLLVEGGPHLLGDFFADHCLDEQFLTLSPQIAGRNGPPERPGFVAGHIFAPEHPLWGTLISLKRAGSHLFLRYAFPTS